MLMQQQLLNVPQGSLYAQSVSPATQAYADAQAPALVLPPLMQGGGRARVAAGINQLSLDGVFAPSAKTPSARITRIQQDDEQRVAQFKRAKEVQVAQLQQVEEKKRLRELQREHERKVDELERLRFQQQVEAEKRAQEEAQNKKRAQLQEVQSGIDANALRKQSRGKGAEGQLEYTDGTTHDIFAPDLTKTLEREQLEQKKAFLQNERERLAVEQRMVRELPIQITLQVRESVNNELMRLKQQIVQQQNALGEQLLNLQSNIQRVSEEKKQAEWDVHNMQQQLRRVQGNDERRRQAFLDRFILRRGEYEFERNTQRVQEEDNMRAAAVMVLGSSDFNFPQRSRPYYNIRDPHLAQYRAPHQHDALYSRSYQVAVHAKDLAAQEVFGRYNAPGRALERRTIDLQPAQPNFRYGPVKKDGGDDDEDNNQQFYKGSTGAHRNSLGALPHIPDDPVNWQGVHFANVDVHNVLAKNQHRLHKLQEIGVADEALNELDTAIFNSVVEDDTLI